MNYYPEEFPTYPPYVSEDGTCPKCNDNDAGCTEYCPYLREIDDQYVLCNCCEDCKNDCSESI